jgi:hypothetical protein
MTADYFVIMYMNSNFILFTLASYNDWLHMDNMSASRTILTYDILVDQNQTLTTEIPIYSVPLNMKEAS